MTGPDAEGLVRRFLAEQVLGEVEVRRIGPDDHLLKMGVLNSLTLTHLIVYLEEQLGIQVLPSEFDPQNFRSIRAICEYVARKGPRAS
jgi:acyl carrier protein